MFGCILCCRLGGEYDGEIGYGEIFRLFFPVLQFRSKFRPQRRIDLAVLFFDRAFGEIERIPCKLRVIGHPEQNALRVFTELVNADKFNGDLLFFFCGFFCLFRCSRVCGNGFLLYLLRLIFFGDKLFFPIHFIDVLLRGFGGREIIAPLRPPAVLDVITDRNDVIVERVGLTMYDRNVSIVSVFFDLEDGITAGCRFLVFGLFLLLLFLHSELILTEPEKTDESLGRFILFPGEEVLRHRLPIPSLYRFRLAAEILFVVLSGQKVSNNLLCFLLRCSL